MSAPVTLLVLAAGMGSRYGGLKQLDPMGPEDQILLDYSVRDAVAAGFHKVVFVIRRDIESAFRQTIGTRYDGTINIDYAFQELDDLPAGFGVPDGRTKPWGTAHAVRAARHQIDGPFAVINADDYYGPEAYQALAQTLSTPTPANSTGPLDLSMVGYRLRNTLSPHGPVNRGICQVDTDGYLQSIRECSDLRADPKAPGLVNGLDATGQPITLNDESVVSMNCWGLPSPLIPRLEPAFSDFLQHQGHQNKSEWYLPAFIDQLMQQGRARCRVLPVEAAWFGVTYPEDRPRVQEALASLP